MTWIPPRVRRIPTCGRLVTTYLPVWVYNAALFVTKGAFFMKLRAKLRSRRGAGIAIVVSAVLTASLNGLASAGAITRAEQTQQLGVDTWVTDQCQSSAAWANLATEQFTAFKGIGANSIGITFPLYMPSLTSNIVTANDECHGPHYTPSPPRLGVLVRIAHSLHLEVLLRPVIDETNLRTEKAGGWRGIIAPTNVKLWFSNYFHALTPYLRMAQQDHVEHFAVTTELDSLTLKPEWASTISASKALYKGNLAFDILWQTNVTQKLFAGTTPALDAYQWVSGATNTTPVSELLKSWDKSLASSARLDYPAEKATIEEIGIPAQDGAYLEPFAWSLPSASHPFNQTIQANWFTMACEFFKENKMGGIYYWGSYLDVGANAVLKTPNPKAPQAIQPRSVASIQKCFTGK